MILRDAEVCSVWRVVWCLVLSCITNTFSIIYLCTIAVFSPQKMDEDAAVHYTVRCCLLVKPLHYHHHIQSIHIYFHPWVHAYDCMNSFMTQACFMLHFVRSCACPTWSSLEMMCCTTVGLQTVASPFPHFCFCCWCPLHVRRQYCGEILLCYRLPLVSGEYHKPRCLSAIVLFSPMLAMIIAFHNMSNDAHVWTQKWICCVTLLMPPSV